MVIKSAHLLKMWHDVCDHALWFILVTIYILVVLQAVTIYVRLCTCICVLMFYIILLMITIGRQQDLFSRKIYWNLYFLKKPYFLNCSLLSHLDVGEVMGARWEGDPLTDTDGLWDRDLWCLWPTHTHTYHIHIV